MPAVAYKELRSKDGGVSPADMRARVEAARAVQRERGYYNAQIPSSAVLQVCALDEAGTVADLDESAHSTLLPNAKMADMARVRFGLFDFNPETGELYRQGRIVRLQAQPAKLLAVLISAQGQLVPRDALRKTLWADGTSVEFDKSLNFAMAQLRSTLGDSADSPTFIRTVPKQGYQFVAPVSELDQQPAAVAQTVSRRRVLSAGAAAGVAAAALGGIAALWGSWAKEIRIAVARFQNETGNPELDRFADTVTDSVVAGMTSRTAGRYGVIGNAAILRRARGFQNLDEIGSALKVQYVIIGQVQRDAARVRVLAHLIRLPQKTHLTVSRIEMGETASESQVAAHIVDELTTRLDSQAAATH